MSGAISTVESIAYLSQQERESDCNSLLRDLVDRAILFAWLAADPGERVDIWEKQDMRKRIAMDNAVKGFGSAVLEPEWRAELEARVEDAEVTRLPPTPQLAPQADEHWKERVRFFREAVPEGKVFEMLYAGVFRYLSGFTHAAPVAIYHLVEDTPKQRVVTLEPTTGPQRAVSFAPLAFVLILFIASETLGWPRESAVHAVVSKHAGALQAEKSSSRLADGRAAVVRAKSMRVHMQGWTGCSSAAASLAGGELGSAGHRIVASSRTDSRARTAPRLLHPVCLRVNDA